MFAVSQCRTFFFPHAPQLRSMNAALKKSSWEVQLVLSAEWCAVWTMSQESPDPEVLLDFRTYFGRFGKRLFHRNLRVAAAKDDFMTVVLDGDVAEPFFFLRGLECDQEIFHQRYEMLVGERMPMLRVKPKPHLVVQTPDEAPVPKLTCNLEAA